MTKPSRFWADWNTRDFAQLDPERMVAVLPVAAIEQHGPHLPLNVDATLVDGVVAAMLAHLPPDLSVLILPTQAIGLSPEHARFPGTLTLKAETVIALWTQIGEAVAHAGIKKLLLLNSHGGQVGVMDIVARDLRDRLGLLVYSVSWFNLPLGDAVDLLFSDDERRFGIHAGAIETSMMLALVPQQVDMTQAQNFVSSAQQRSQQYEILGNGRSAKLGWQIQDYNVQGAVGNAAAASADKGQAVIDAAALALGQLLAEVSRLPLNTLVELPTTGVSPGL